MSRSFKDLMISNDAGTFAIRDWGGTGPDVLLVHGTGHNVEAWGLVANLLPSSCHPVAFDLRGHGQTPVDSENAQQYWQDIGCIIESLHLRRPVLVGHSTGGYAVTAFAASGGPCSALVVIDGFVPDDRDVTLRIIQSTDWAAMRTQLWDLFRYGWRADEQELEEYIRDQCAKAHDDWLNQGIDAEVVARLTKRSFLQQGEFCLRRPTLEEIDVVRQPALADVFPSVEVYAKVKVPMRLVLAMHGLYANRRDALLGMLGSSDAGDIVVIDSGHNVPLQHPQEVVAAIIPLLRHAPGLSAPG